MLAAVYRGLPSKGVVDGRVGGPGVSFRRVHVLRFMFHHVSTRRASLSLSLSVSLSLSLSRSARSRTTARGLNFR